MKEKELEQREKELQKIEEEREYKKERNKFILQVIIRLSMFASIIAFWLNAENLVNEFCEGTMSTKSFIICIWMGCSLGWAIGKHIFQEQQKLLDAITGSENY